ncbi:MAG: hypothetical protein J5873_02300 [Bacteroidales bacterium]|nr:hypothetical protein [Bacteroidales bacterium]
MQSKENQEQQEVQSVENSLVALRKLQIIHSKIDKIRTYRGELPLEVRDLEAACEGIETRINKINDIIADFQGKIAERETISKNASAAIARYKEQIDNVRNNREYDALNKEIEYQSLEIELSNKRIDEYRHSIESKEEEIASCKAELETMSEELKTKKAELDGIIAETEKEETRLLENVEKYEIAVEPRLLVAFKRIRNNMRNGLAVVKIERDACGGCFSKISPQRQLDIRIHKKIIVCEFCGRILIDDDIADKANQEMQDLG